MFIAISDFNNSWYLDNRIEESISILERILLIKYDGYNSFWLTIQNEEYPAITIGMKDDLSVLNYFKNQNGNSYNWVSESNLIDLDQDGETGFHLTSLDELQEMSNDVVVRTKDGIDAVKEFFLDPFSKPKSIQWTEL